MGAGIYDDNLDLVVSACSDASEDWEDKLKEEGVCVMVLPFTVDQGNVSLYKLNCLHSQQKPKFITSLLRSSPLRELKLLQNETLFETDATIPRGMSEIQWNLETLRFHLLSQITKNTFDGAKSTTYVHFWHKLSGK